MTTIIRNCSTMSKRVKGIVLLVCRISDINTKIEDIESRIKSGSLWDIFFSTPKEQYLKLVRKAMIGSLMKNFSYIPRGVLKGCPHILLDAGSTLFSAGKYPHSLQCFNSVIESLDRDDQNIRIPALMGRLECKIALECAPLCIEECQDYSHIIDALHATEKNVQEDIKARLARARVRVRMFAISDEGEAFRKAYNNTF